jgi:hypothetical protein
MADGATPIGESVEKLIDPLTDEERLDLTGMSWTNARRGGPRSSA